MDINNYVSIASQFMLVGAVCECIAIIVGHAIFSVIDIMKGG